MSVAESAGGWRCSVILVHRHGAADLQDAVDSIAAQGGSGTELILIDNASTDHGVDTLAVDPSLHLRRIHSSRNLGFAAAANLGLAASRAPLVLLLNPDARLQAGALRHLEAALVEGVAAAAPRIVQRDEPKRLDNAGQDLLADGLNWCRGRGEAAELWDAPGDVFLFSGAAVLLDRRAVERAGPFPGHFFAYGEDADLGLRLARLGLRCRYVPEAIVEHRIGGSFGRFSLWKAWLVERNRIEVAVVHLPWPMVLRAPFSTLGRTLLLARQARSGEGLAAGFSPGARALLPLCILGADLAALWRLPASMRRRAAWRARVTDERGLDEDAWAGLLARRVASNSVVSRRGSDA